MEKRPTKKQMKYASDNPWVCPSCELRFPTKEIMKKHWNKNDICDEYQFEGLIALSAIGINGATAMGNFDNWRKKQPKKMLERGI